MSLTKRSSTLSFAAEAKQAKHASYPYHTSRSNSQPYSTLLFSTDTSEPAQLKHDPTQRPHSIAHHASVASFMSSSTANYTVNTNSIYTHPASSNLQRQVVSKNTIRQNIKHQQKVNQKKALPLFPTERTRGGSSVHNTLKPVDITKIDLMPIEYSHKIIMCCIDEIKLRGLKHKHLFRNAFYSPSVEGALKLLKDPKKSQLFSVKMMRVDTVAGLLTTVLSRTYPPLIPPHVQEMFQNPNGNLLPELNRFLFVEILDLCCDLVDNSLYNHLSSSRLSVYPGSCCFGLDEFMPTWDTRYLLSTTVKKFTGAFYHIIYAYREERDLSADELEQKLVTRDKLLAEQRLEALEREHGLEGAHNILKREARIAKGLPPDSPVVIPHLPADVKEISLYANRKERVVADDAISVLDMQLDDGADTAVVQKLQIVEVKTQEEENVEHVLADLRKSISVATLEYYATRSSSSRTLLSNSSTSTLASSRTISRSHPLRNSPATRPNLVRAKSSTARFGTIEQNIYPVSPGDIFGISQHAIQRRELQNFLSIARTEKKRRTITSKRIMQLRLQNRMLRQFSSISSFTSSSDSGLSGAVPSRPRTGAAVPICIMYRNRDMHSGQRQLYRTHTQSTFSQLKTSPVSTHGLRRERTRQLRKELKVYETQGLSAEEAMEQREIDMKKKRRREKRARLAAQAKAEAAAQEEALERAAAEAAAAIQAEDDVTMEEAEILEAFDYLSDQEFEEFMALAGLTMQDVERIREKAAAAALNQVTKDIQSVDVKITPSKAETDQDSKQEISNHDSGIMVPTITTATNTIAEPSATASSFGSAYSLVAEPTTRQRRPLSIPHMTSMDLLLKNATMIGDSNLRCYPAEKPVTEPTHGGLLSQAAAVIAQPQPKDEVVAPITVPSVPTSAPGQEQREERKSEESTASSTETVVVVESTEPAMKNYRPSPEPLLITRSIPDVKSRASKFEQAMERAQNALHSKILNRTNVEVAPQPAKIVIPAVIPRKVFDVSSVYEVQRDEDEDDDDTEGEELQVLEVESDDGESTVELTMDELKDFDEEAELRELLEAMTEDERQEFVRLSRQEAMVSNTFSEGVYA
ncbi:hypothetical protein BGZ54_009287 [Gamsiella multidivaricata]|nr:hypothetical protein BGZ54_009287 [Gamsiella multidivaricata]